MEYLFQEDYIKAKKYFYKCVEENTLDYQSLYNLLYCYEQLGENIEAINTLNNLLEIKPYSEVAWHQLGKYTSKSISQKKHFLPLNLLSSATLFY